MSRSFPLGLLAALTIATFLAIPPRPARASSVVGTISGFPAGDIPLAMAADPNANRVYIVGLSNIVSIDGASNTILASAYTADWGGGIALNPAGTALYTSAQFPLQPFQQFDPSTLTFTLLDDQRFGDYPTALAFNPNDNQLCVLSWDTASLRWVNPLDRRFPQLPLTFYSLIDQSQLANPGGIAVNRVTNRIYVETTAAYWNSDIGNDYVAVLDGSTHQVLAQIPVKPSVLDVGFHDGEVGGIPVAVNETTNRIYTTNYAGYDSPDGSRAGVVTVIDGDTNTVLTEIPVGLAPVGLAVSPNGRVYVTNMGDGTVSVIDGETNQVVETIPVGTYPQAAAVLNDYLYVAGFSGPISVVDLGATQPTATPTTVTPSPTVSLDFPNIATGGDVTVAPLNGSPPPPAGTQFGIPDSTSTAQYPTYFDIDAGGTTFSGYVEVCGSYDPALFVNSTPVLVHYVKDGSGNYVPDPDPNAQSTYDATNHTVCVQVASFSPFAVFAKPVDSTPPAITLRDGNANVVAPGGTLTATASTTAGAAVSFSASATDDVDGPVPVHYSLAPSSTFAPGVTQVTVTARDSSGNSASATFNVAVTYSWSGVLQPVNAGGSSVFKLGSTVPVKFQLTGAGAGITNLVAKLYVAQQDTVDPTAVNEAVSTATADSGNTFRYDPTAHQYVFNLSTKSLSKGTWYLRLDLGDGTNNIVVFKLK